MRDGKCEDAERGAAFSAGESVRESVDSRVHKAVQCMLATYVAHPGSVGFSSVRIGIVLIP